QPSGTQCTQPQRPDLRRTIGRVLLVDGDSDPSSPLQSQSGQHSENRRYTSANRKTNRVSHSLNPTGNRFGFKATRSQPRVDTGVRGKAARKRPESARFPTNAFWNGGKRHPRLF